MGEVTHCVVSAQRLDMKALRCDLSNMLHLVLFSIWRKYTHFWAFALLFFSADAKVCPVSVMNGITIKMACIQIYLSF